MRCTYTVLAGFFRKSGDSADTTLAKMAYTLISLEGENGVNIVNKL